MTTGSEKVRLMALELIVSDMLATIYRNTADPAKSLDMKRVKFRWLLEEHKDDIASSLDGKFYPEELQAAIEQLFAMASAMNQKK